jgi:hypothetical protein
MYPQKHSNVLGGCEVAVESAPIRNQIGRLSSLIDSYEHNLRQLDERIAPYISDMIGEDRPKRETPRGSALLVELAVMADKLEDLNERLYRTIYTIQQ